MNSKLLAFVLASATLAGCAVPTQKMDTNAVNALKDQTVVQTARPMPDFAVMTAAKVAFGFAAGPGMIPEGNRILAQYQISDPATQIGSDLMGALTEGRGAKSAAAPVSVSSTDTAEIASASKGAARYALDVQTLFWHISYFPTDWAHYRLVYNARARLIDTETKAVLAQGSCKIMPETNAGAPTYEEMLADDAAWLKLEMAHAASACTENLKSSMLAL